MESNKNTETKQTQGAKEKSTNASMNGTEKPSAWEKAAEMIAGDNQLMSSLLKLLLSPFTLIAGAGLIIYLFVKNKQYKDEITKLKEDLKKLAEENLSSIEEVEAIRKKYKKLKRVFEIEQSQSENLALNEAKSNEMVSYNSPKNKLAYLR